MLTWLHITFDMAIDVMGYSEAHGMFTEISDGVHWISEVILYARITYGPKSTATPAAEARLHELAQGQCFIADDPDGPSLLLYGRSPGPPQLTSRSIERPSAVDQSAS
jgi:hypothetical protein